MNLICIIYNDLKKSLWQFASLITFLTHTPQINIRLIFRSYKILRLGDSKFLKNTGLRVIIYFPKGDAHNTLHPLNPSG